LVKLLLPVLLIALTLPSVAWSDSTVPADSLQTHWGLMPAPSDSTMTTYEKPGTPAWQVALLVPYYVVGVPLMAIDEVFKWGLQGLDDLGLFAATSQVVAGIRDPLGNYWLPEASIGDAKGLSIGIIGQRPDFPLPGWRTKGSLSTSTKKATSWSLGTITNFKQGSWFELGGGARELAQANYYGTGVGTTEEDRSVYSRDIGWIGVGWHQELNHGLELTLNAHYSTAEARQSRYEREHDIEDVHAGDLPYGYDMMSSGLSPGLQLGYDNTRETGRPDWGHRFLVFAQYFASTDDQKSEFWTNGVTLEHFVNLGRPQRTLAMKAWWTRQWDVGDDPIPFTRQLRNRGPYQLRGYSSTRFVARGMTGMTAEYRWPVWMLNEPEKSGVDAYIFGDVGQPFDEFDELAIDNLFWSAGFGFRVVNRESGFSVRIELATGMEGLQARLTTDQIFQFLKAGFHGGSEPIPVMR